MSASWAERVSSCAPYLAVEARCLLARLAPDRWALEWSLPYWLGQRFGLARETALGLVVSNLLGLGFVRLQDDLVDGDPIEQPAKSVSPGRANALLLSAALHHLWLASLLKIFGEDSRFWRRFDDYMLQWQAATWLSLQPSALPFAEYRSADFLALAHRGAPLKACVAGACLLGGCARHLPALAAAVDNLLIGAVLLDEASDWEEDLARGRTNLFVSYATNARWVPGEPASRRRVSMALLAGEGASPYFAKVRTYLTVAADMAEEAEVTALVDYTRWLDQAAAARDGELRRRARVAHRAAGARLTAALASAQSKAG